MISNRYFQEHLGYPFKKLGVAYYPFFQNVHFPQVPICSNYSFSPRTNLPQVPIYFGVHAPRVFFCHLSSAHMPRCPFASNAYICPKCPFTPNSLYSPNIDLLQCPRTIVPIISPNPHLPRCPFAPSTQMSETQISGTHLSGTQMYGPQIFGTICPGVHLSWCLFCRGASLSRTQMYGPNCPRPICLVPLCPGAPLSWCPFVRDPFVRDPNVRKPPVTPHTYIS